MRFSGREFLTAGGGEAAAWAAARLVRWDYPHQTPTFRHVDHVAPAPSYIGTESDPSDGIARHRGSFKEIAVEGLAGGLQVAPALADFCPCRKQRGL